MALTLKTINKELTRRGIKAELVRGKDYFYFVGDDCDVSKSTSVMVSRLNQLTLAQWIDEINEIKGETT